MTMRILPVMISVLMLSSCYHDHGDPDPGNTIIYQNDFSDESLSDFIVVEKGVATIAVTAGWLQINPGDGYTNSGHLALDLRLWSDQFKPRLSENTAKITWAFNVYNVDGTVCGSCNNMYGMHMNNIPDFNQSGFFGYTFGGGGYVADRMVLKQFASSLSPVGPVSNFIIDITDGLGNYPAIGAFKLTYEPATNTWYLYYEESTEVIDPLKVTTLVGTAVIDGFTHDELPYFILSGQNTSSTYFDNLTVMFE